jgi:hypothetical protein
MLRLILTVGLGVFFLHGSQAQLRRFYSLNDVSTFDTVVFNLKATSGISFVRHVKGGNPLHIFGNPDLDKINPSFDVQVENRICNVQLTLDEFRSSGFGDGLVFAMLNAKSKSEEDPNYWKILLNDRKVYDLNLNYGIGSSDIDLSGVFVRNLKINTGSADVVVNYKKGQPNLCKMDTFMVKVDLGSLIAKDLHHSRSRNVVAEIGFGQALLDFSSVLDHQCNVTAAIGAGSLEVVLPRDAPVIIQIKDSPLCSVTMAKGFEEVEQNVFISMSYDSYAENLLTFHVDVTLGNVTFTYED